MAADVDHKSRAHATWSASATAANWACPGRLSLIDGISDTPSAAAAWGTACHEISELCLRDGHDAISFVGRIVGGVEVDEEMAECAQAYVDYVQAAGGNFMGRGVPSGRALLIEQRFSLASLSPPFEAGGTCDAIAYKAAKNEVEVIDLKAGRGVVVEATGNPQLRTYALGAMLANPTLPVERVTVTIVQPRAQHKDGRIRSETFHVIDLIEWTADLLEAMRRAKSALDARPKMDAALWADSFLRAGDHCKFCPAAGFCPALEAKALAVAHAHFTPQGVVEMTLPDPAKLDGDRVAAVLDVADLFEDWLNAVRARGQWLAEAGYDVPGYQLVDKQARRKWIDEDVASAWLEDIPEAFVVKLKSPTQVEKAIGKARYGKLAAPNVDKKSSGQNLVATAKTTRPASASASAKFLQPIT